MIARRNGTCLNQQCTGRALAVIAGSPIMNGLLCFANNPKENFLH
jgi:hypothetical protein